MRLVPRSWTNPPLDAAGRRRSRPHAEFAVHQALAVAARSRSCTPPPIALGDDTWRVEVGVANTGWLPTYVTARAQKHDLVLPIVADLTLPEGAEVIGGPNRHELGQLAGRSGFRLDGGSRNDGTPDRALTSWIVRAPAGAQVEVAAVHQRAGTRARRDRPGLTGSRRVARRRKIRP